MTQTKTYNFGETDVEKVNGKEVRVYQTPKYLQSKKKAIEMLESEQYKNVLDEGDFWILKNNAKNGSCVLYSGLIISHNGCLKINDVLEPEKKFKPDCFHVEQDEYTGGLLGVYIDEDLVEYGEVTKTNCKNAYPYAMVLKRTMDRVILKKSKLAYYGVYSDSEADEFKEQQEVSTIQTKPNKATYQSDTNNDKLLGELILRCSKAQHWLSDEGVDIRSKDFVARVHAETGLTTQDYAKLNVEELTKLIMFYEKLSREMKGIN